MTGPAALHHQIVAILMAWNTPATAAATVADVLLWADLRGIDSHGISMLTMYDDWRRAGRMNVDALPTRLIDTPVSLAMSGAGGFGHVVCDSAMRTVIGKAKSSGITVAAVSQSSHCGALGYYTEMAAEAGLIALFTTQTPGVRVAPTGAAAARLGTDPFSFAAPAEDGRHFILDMATTTVAYGKIRNKANEDAGCPLGWVLDPSGRPSTDPEDAVSRGGFMTPLGGTEEGGSHKGYGLAAMVNILSSCLSGSTLSTAPEHQDRPNDLGQFILAFDPALFRNAGDFSGDVSDFCNALRETAPLDPAQPVMVAGDSERRRRAQREAGDIHIPIGLKRRLQDIAEMAGTPWFLD